MEEITRQMFQNLEEVIDSHWNRVREEGNYLREANVQTIDELCKYMKKKYELSAYEEQKITLIAVDSEGGYYTERGNRGLFRDFDYFEDTKQFICKNKAEGACIHNIHFVRSSFCSRNYDCYKKLKVIIDENNFDLIQRSDRCSKILCITTLCRRDD